MDWIAIAKLVALTFTAVIAFLAYWSRVKKDIPDIDINIVGRFKLENKIIKPVLPEKILKNVDKKIPNDYYNLGTVKQLNDFLLLKNIDAGHGFWCDTYLEHRDIATIFLITSETPERMLSNTVLVTEVKCINIQIKTIQLNSIQVIKNSIPKLYEHKRVSTTNINAYIDSPFNDGYFYILFMEIRDPNVKTNWLYDEEYQDNPVGKNLLVESLLYDITLISTKGDSFDFNIKIGHEEGGYRAYPPEIKSKKLFNLN